MKGRRGEGKGELTPDGWAGDGTVIRSVLLTCLWSSSSERGVVCA